jgi:hypothetical protein
MTPVMRGALLKVGIEDLIAVDSEFQQDGASLPKPVCLAYRSLMTGVGDVVWLWGRSRPCPFRMAENIAFIAYNFAAEANIMFACGWGRPLNVLDCWLDYIQVRNTWPPAGVMKKERKRLFDALHYFGLETRDSAEKEYYQELAQQGGPFTRGRPQKMCKYCLDDTDDVVRLFDPLAAKLHLEDPVNLEHAFLRGRFAVAVASMWRTGTPMDCPRLAKAEKHRVRIQNRLIKEFDKIGVYDLAELSDGDAAGDAGRAAGSATAKPAPADSSQIHFRRDRMVQLIEDSGLAGIWPRTDSGKMFALDNKTLSAMSPMLPCLGPLIRLRAFIGKLRPFNFPVGSDGRSRVSLFPFATKTGRNAPHDFIFAADKGLCGFIKPGPGQAVSYLDWERQELAVAAYLSGDENLLRLAKSDDPYLQLGISFGLIPVGGTKDTHPEMRQRCKAIVLGLLYGMAPRTVAAALGLSESWGRAIRLRHRQEYRRYWEWAEAQALWAAARQPLRTPYGHTLSFDDTWDVNFKETTAKNFLVQGTSAEIMRFAAILSTEDDISVCAPVHDAFLIEASIDEIEAVIARMKVHMAKAVEIVLGPGCSIAVEHKIARYPEACTWERSELFDVILAEIAAAEKGPESPARGAEIGQKLRLAQRAY